MAEPTVIAGLARTAMGGMQGELSDVAAPVLGALGAQVTAIHDEPNGTNINDGCGSTHPEDLQAAVVAVGADVGLAFDGDADRVLAVDAAGALVDGDQVIGLFYDQDTRAEEFDSETTLGRVVDFVIELHAPGIAEIEARLEEIETAIFAATFSGIECVELGETRFYRDQEGQRFVGIAALTIRFFYAVQRANPSVLS